MQGTTQQLWLKVEGIKMALKGIYLRIPEDVHKKAKLCALKKNTPLQCWVTQLLIAGIYKDLYEQQEESTEKFEEPPV